MLMLIMIGTHCVDFCGIGAQDVDVYRVDARTQCWHSRLLY